MIRRICISKSTALFFLSTLILLMFVLFAYAENDISLPKKKSELDGWQGIKIRKGGDCGPRCCLLIFPKNFGYANKRQLEILRKLVSDSTYFEHDVDCWMPINNFALNHVRYLAVERQDADAALLLVDRLNHGQFNLTGELEEEYSGEYELPVLEKYKDINHILSEKNEDILSDSLCAWAMPRNEQDRIEKLVNHLSSQVQL